jgi:glycosyltransferase involved in cell wall biosynthesis
VKKRILQLIGSFHLGGSETQAVALTGLLREEGSFEVLAATLNNEGALKQRFVDVYPEDIPEYRLTSFYDINFVRQVHRFAKYLRENNVDLIHTHDFYTNVFGMAAATLAGTRVRIASKRESEGMRSAAQDAIEKIAFGRADAILVNSRTVLNHLARRNIPTLKMRHIYNGTDLERFHKTATSSDSSLPGLPEGENIRFVTQVANLRHSVKNIPMLLRAAKRVKDVHPDVRFVIAGEGELEQELRRLALELDVADRVHFIGRCNDVPSLLFSSSACVLTSTAEGFSNSLIEYMAAGRPVVATNVGGAAEAIDDGVTGYLVTPDDDRAMAEHLIELLSDEVKAGQMGDEGRRIAHEKFSHASQLSKILDLYNDHLTK